MNYVAFVIYKHKLTRMSYNEAQTFIIEQVQYQNDRLISSLTHAIRQAKPGMLYWYDQLIGAMT